MIVKKGAGRIFHPMRVHIVRAFLPCSLRSTAFQISLASLLASFRGFIVIRAWRPLVGSRMSTPCTDWWFYGSWLLSEIILAKFMSCNLVVLCFARSYQGNQRNGIMFSRRRLFKHFLRVTVHLALLRVCNSTDVQFYRSFAPWHETTAAVAVLLRFPLTWRSVMAVMSLQELNYSE